MQITNKERRNDEPMDIDEGPSCNGLNGNQNNGINDEFDHISDDEEGGVRVGDIYIPPAPKPALTFDATGPRLLITHIVNENFKSYAGVQSLGPFHKSFTAIIGPNGSGKSNVIDSMLFVFGYRAAKIRSKKISVLIHSSSKFPNIISASVAVHFCQIIDGEGEEFTVVPNSEIVVSRTAHRDNSSYYALNGRRVQFKEVAKMLRSHGIDLDHNRFLILQGEVEQIAMMKPKGLTEHESGMLEYLEDIIGTSRYKEPIEKLSERVEVYTELRKEKLNRVRLVEQEKQKLEQPMKEAVEQMNLSNIVIRTRNTLLQKYMHETNKIIEEKEKDLAELKKNLDLVNANLNELKEKLQEKSTIYSNETQKFETFKKQRAEVIEKLQFCKKKMVTVVADTSQSNKKKKNLDQLLEGEKGKLMDLELIPEKNNKEIKECESLLARHTESKRLADKELETVMSGVRAKTKSLQDTKDALQAKLIDLKKIVDTLNKTFKLAESELNIYLSNEKTETEKYERMKEAYDKASNDLEEKRTLQKELASSHPSNERLLTERQTKLQSLKNEECNILAKARSLRSQLEESRRAMSVNKSRGRVLDALMNEKRNGNIPGIFGRLGDLGGIDAKYDVAISTCCGSLDNIVVDNVETAQACVEFLKRHNVGRATFIILDKQQHLQQYYERRVTFPENAPRLFDLVQVRDERVLTAFYFALRDTLVANDLDQASRISFGSVRYRVVTLKGQVIEIAGAMSGGGKTVIRGKMSSTVQQDTSDQDPRVIQANEKELSDFEARLLEIRSEQSQLEDSVVTLQRTTLESKTTLNKLNTDLKNLVQQLPPMKEQIKQQKAKAASSKVDPAQTARLEAVLADAQGKLEKAKHDAGEVEKEVHGVEAKISAIAGGQVKDLQKIVDDLANKIAKVSNEITKLKVAINTSIRNAKKSKDKINQMQADLEETEKNLENLSNQKKQLSLDITKLQKDMDELEEQINEGTGEFASLKQEIVELQKQENTLLSERLAAKEALVKWEKSIIDCRSKIPQWKRELGSLKLEDPGIDGIDGIGRPAPLEQHSADQLEQASVDELRNRLAAQKGRIGDAKPNIQAIQDYKTKEELYLKRAAELDEITMKRNDMRTLHDQLRKKRSTDFLSGFNTITAKLKEMYQMITLGGDAELELVDSLDPFSEGIIFSVRPPNKSWKNISNLSGGEKTLSSLALVFALHYYKPTPLYVMDEIDAALDFKNVSIVANYIKERTRNAQFIIISLRYNMFEVSNRLIGIYKTEDCTKSVTVENKLPEPASNEKTA